MLRGRPCPHRGLCLTLLMLAALALGGCTPKNSARGVVDRFIEAHYIAIDLKSTEPLCAGLALDKIRSEMQLTAGLTIDESTRKPIIHYTLERKRDEPDHVSFLFRARIDVPDGGSFNRFWMITARKDGELWKISNYSEYE